MKYNKSELRLFGILFSPELWQFGIILRCTWDSIGDTVADNLPFSFIPNFSLKGFNLFSDCITSRDIPREKWKVKRWLLVPWYILCFITKKSKKPTDRATAVTKSGLTNIYFEWFFKPGRGDDFPPTPQFRLTQISLTRCVCVCSEFLYVDHIHNGNNRERTGCVSALLFWKIWNNKQTTLLAPKVNERLWVCEPNPNQTDKKVFPVPGAGKLFIRKLLRHLLYSLKNICWNFSAACASYVTFSWCPFRANLISASILIPTAV